MTVVDSTVAVAEMWPVALTAPAASVVAVRPLAAFVLVVHQMLVGVVAVGTGGWPTLRCACAATGSELETQPVVLATPHLFPLTVETRHDPSQLRMQTA